MPDAEMDVVLTLVASVGRLHNVGAIEVEEGVAVCLSIFILFLYQDCYRDKVLQWVCTPSFELVGSAL